MDLMSVKWEYEPRPFGLGGDLGTYVPDFRVYVEDDEDGYYVWLEVKGKAPDMAAIKKAETLGDITEEQVVIAYGGFPGQVLWVEWQGLESDTFSGEGFFDDKKAALSAMSKAVQYRFDNE